MKLGPEPLPDSFLLADFANGLKSPTKQSAIAARPTSSDWSR